MAGIKVRCPCCKNMFVVPPCQIEPDDDRNIPRYSKLQSVGRLKGLIILRGVLVWFVIMIGTSLVVWPVVQRKPGSVRSIPAVKAILGNAESPEWEAVKRYVLRNSLKPDSIHFEKWFPAKDANPEDSNAFEFRFREDPKVASRIEELDRLIRTEGEGRVAPQPVGNGLEVPGRDVVILFNGEQITEKEYRRRKEEYQRGIEKLQESIERVQAYQSELAAESNRLYMRYKVMTTDRVVRVITRTDIPIVGPIRTDDFYYLKDGKVVKSKSGTPADHDELINTYYPGED
jgi:hypothetical protein